jgi:hypothetical protein
MLTRNVRANGTTATEKISGRVTPPSEVFVMNTTVRSPNGMTIRPPGRICATSAGVAHGSAAGTIIHRATISLSLPVSGSRPFPLHGRRFW